MLNNNYNSIWDNKISSQKIFDRNLLLNPPLQPKLNPPLIDKVRNESKNSGTFLNISPKIERDIANHWYYYIYKNPKTVRISNKPKTIKLRSLIQKYPNRPWIHGITYNIDNDTFVKYEYKNNNHDCISFETLENENINSIKSSIKMMNKYFSISNNYPNQTKNWLNNTTKAKNNY